MEKIWSLKLGETAFLPTQNQYPIESIIASINEPFFIGDNGKKVARNETIKLVDERGHVHFLRMKNKSYRRKQ